MSVVGSRRLVVVERVGRVGGLDVIVVGGERVVALLCRGEVSSGSGSRIESIGS